MIRSTNLTFSTLSDAERASVRELSISQPPTRRLKTDLSNHPLPCLATLVLSTRKRGGRCTGLTLSPCVSLPILPAFLADLRVAEYLPESKAYVFNAGAPVWALDWCPIHVDDRSSRCSPALLLVHRSQNREGIQTVPSGCTFSQQFSFPRDWCQGPTPFEFLHRNMVAFGKG